MGLNFCLSRDGTPVQMFYSDKRAHNGWQSPLTWGAVRLAGPRP